MYKKLLLFLLICTANQQFFSMQQLLDINSPIIKRQAHSFLDFMLDKTFSEIKIDFQELPTATKRRVLATSGDANPLIMMAVCLPHDQRVEVISHTLDSDKASAHIFCALPLNKALYRYNQAEEQAECYQYFVPGAFDLPIGFHYRTSDKACQLISKAIQSTQRQSFLTDKEMEQLYKLFRKDSWIIEKLSLKSLFLYRSLTMKDKLDNAMDAIDQVDWSDISLHSLFLLGVTNGWVVCIPLFLCMGLLENVCHGSNDFLKNLSKTIVYEFVPATVKLVGATSTLYTLYCIVKNYCTNKHKLLEQKKTYI